MREGSRNEIEILRALPQCLETNKGAYKKGLWSSSFTHDETVRFNVQHVRCTGVIESKNFSMLADSPDAILCMTDDEGVTHLCAV